MYQYNNPYQNYPFPTNQGQLIRVNGIESARAYSVAPGSTMPLFDSNEDIMYIKSVDGSGFPTIRRFRFEEENELTNEGASKYVTKEEFEVFKKEVLNNGKQSIQQSTNKAKQNKPTSISDGDTD